MFFPRERSLVTRESKELLVGCTVLHMRENVSKMMCSVCISAFEVECLADVLFECCADLGEKSAPLHLGGGGS